MQRKAHDATKPQQPFGCEDLVKECNAAMRFLGHPATELSNTF